MTDPTKGFLQGARELARLLKKVGKERTTSLPELVQVFFLIEATRADLDGWQANLIEAMQAIPRPLLEDQFKQLKAYFENLPGQDRPERLALLKQLKELVND
ncbi:MAG: hypothetical protein F4135_09530 [Acidimicrobiia bacterium]|nr:hypothetical protein [Acidimicrobiia bacterium]MYH56346.1 hypothetical protein [Acidimicrobiia bacterium]